MNCKHNYQFGERLILHVTGSTMCQNCGCSHNDIMDNAAIIFKGHNQGIALFDLEKPFRCPTCEAYTSGYGEYCDNLSVGFSIDAVVKLGGTN